MITLTDHLLETATELDHEFVAALNCGKPYDDYATLAYTRAQYGFVERPTILLTKPDGNMKLAKGVVPSYGLTLAHFRTVLPAGPGLSRSGFTRMNVKRLSVNACPNAGHCTKVCVLDNGNGAYDSVQRARKWRTDLLARHPEAFVRILAWELTRAVRKHGKILFRPNVNSDVAWHRVLPSLCSGHLPGVLSYGYSKLPETLEGNGWLGDRYRVAYSWNETSDPNAVEAFLRRGGAVAVVTSRRKGTPPLNDYPFGWWPAVDADVTDEWMFDFTVVGDLSAKGKARRLIGKSKFVVTP